jgi:hypothetical protein
VHLEHSQNTHCNIKLGDVYVDVKHLKKSEARKKKKGPHRTEASLSL